MAADHSWIPVQSDNGTKLGSYNVEDGIITVRSVTGATESTQVGGLPADVLARAMLGEAWAKSTAQA